MTVPLTLDPTSALTVSEQLRLQLVERIRFGSLGGGTRLPPVRALAVELGVAPGTVAKVYRSLEQEGYVRTAGRLGTVVADQYPSTTDGARRRIRAAVQPLLDQGRSPAEVLQLVRSVLEE